jgi:hypothetical protein
MTVGEIYRHYQLMPNLQQHMFRVAAVAEVIGRELLKAKLSDAALSFTDQDLQDVLAALLLHDLGNMAKFKLDYFPEFVLPEGLAYWQAEQEQFWAKYGKNAHQATLQMLDELGVSSRVKELVDSVSFNKAKKNLDSPDYARKLCAYADMRVGPHGVVSLEERFRDGQKRYQPEGKVDRFSYAMAACLRKIEHQLFAPLSIGPEEITDQRVSPLLATYVDLQFHSIYND